MHKTAEKNVICADEFGDVNHIFGFVLPLL